MSAFLAGQRVTAAQLNLATSRIIAWGSRVSNSSATSGTTELGVLRIDDIPVKSGQQYRIFTNTFGLTCSVATDVPRALLRYTTDGSTPTTSSTGLNLTQHKFSSNAESSNFGAVDALYVPSADETLSVLLTIVRAVGTGTVTMVGAAANPVQLYIEYAGQNTGNVGTAI